jgi:TRAP-type C4-dicarboxylate transport system permease small subunit
MTASIASSERQDPAWLALLAGLSSALNRVAAVIASIVLLGMIGLILVEISMRLFSRSTHMTDVLVGYGVAFVTFLSMAWGLESSAMIRVGVVRRIVGPASKWAMELFSAVATLALMAFFGFFAFRSLARNLESGSLSQHYVQIPLWIPDAVFFTGIALVVLHLLVRTLRLFAVGLVDEPELEL